MNQTNNLCNQRKCVQCEKEVYGRLDKFFCGVNSKNHFNKTQRAYKKGNIQRIEDILNKNYFIREGLFKSKSIPVEIDSSTLSKLGYSTNVIANTNKEGNACCFDYFLKFINQTKITIYLPENRKKHNRIFYDRWYFRFRHLYTNLIDTPNLIPKSYATKNE